MQTKAEEKVQQQQNACDKLRELIKPNDVVSTVLRHVTSSGMSRSVSVIVCDDGQPDDVSYLVARALDRKIDQIHGGVKVGGCGMDAGFELVYNLARTLYPVYECLGAGDADRFGSRCPSNTHVNPGPERDNYGSDAPDAEAITRVFHTDGYSLHQRWI